MDCNAARALVLSALLFGSAAPGKTVALIGAGGGLGPPLSALLRQSSLISNLRLYDVSPVAGLACDLQHINATGNVTAYAADDIGDCLVAADVVIVAASIAHSPGMSREEHFEANAEIMLKISEACARYCPEAMLLVCTEPTTMVPLASEVFRRANVRRAFERILGADVDSMYGRCDRGRCDRGHIYSRALATARFVDRVLAGCSGEENVVVGAFVHCKRGPAPYMNQQVALGLRGIQQALPFGRLSAAEQRELEELVPKLVRAAERGKEFVAPRRGGYRSAIT
ncbi:lactate/malate dehydrogenase [Pavlovales sp. CCMP2436]|nr:lactate/malate dehydrogenase [Pavlovales sp. CCMP2436]